MKEETEGRLICPGDKESRLPRLPYVLFALSDLLQTLRTAAWVYRWNCQASRQHGRPIKPSQTDQWSIGFHPFRRKDVEAAVRSDVEPLWDL